MRARHAPRQCLRSRGALTVAPRVLSKSVPSPPHKHRLPFFRFCVAKPTIVCVSSNRGFAPVSLSTTLLPKTHPQVQCATVTGRRASAKPSGTLIRLVGAVGVRRLLAPCGTPAAAVLFFLVCSSDACRVPRRLSRLRAAPLGRARASRAWRQVRVRLAFLPRSIVV